MARVVLFITYLAIPAACPAADPLNDAKKAYADQDYTAARKHAEAAVKIHGADPDALYLLGQSCLRLRDNKSAATAFTKLIAAAPDEWSGYDGRGDARLKLGEFKDAVRDYDQALKLNPEFAPKHWRRGIALYYAGDFKAGAEQFETHKTANPEDVENAAWHYMCNSRVVGKDKARSKLIDVTRDRRVPMAEIQKLFAGKLEPTAVLARSEKTQASTELGKEARFYANLYVGLWYEAEGNAAKAKLHIAKAVNDFKIRHYMWDVGAVHLMTLDTPADAK